MIHKKLIKSFISCSIVATIVLSSMTLMAAVESENTTDAAVLEAEKKESEIPSNTVNISFLDSKGNLVENIALESSNPKALARSTEKTKTERMIDQMERNIPKPVNRRFQVKGWRLNTDGKVYSKKEISSMKLTEGMSFRAVLRPTHR